VVWRQLASRLRKAGHEVYAPTLTGIGAPKHLPNRGIDLDTHIQDVIGVIDDADLSHIVGAGNSGRMLLALRLHPNNEATLMGWLILRWTPDLETAGAAS
jgi:hypothetical protein